MLEREASSSSNDKKLKVLLKEYEALRTEVITRLQMQTQLTTVTSLLIGVVIGAIPFLISIGTQKQLINISPLILVTFLLLISALFISLVWVILEQDAEMAYISRYLIKVIRKRALELIEGITISEEPIFAWEFYRFKELFEQKIPDKWGTKLFKSQPMEQALSVSRYVLTGIPIPFAMGAAVTIYITNPNYPRFSLDFFNVFNWVFFILN